MRRKIPANNLPDKGAQSNKYAHQSGRGKDELSENFSKEIENTKKNQSELKNTIAEMKTTLLGINSRLEDAEQVSNLEDMEMEIYLLEEKK